MSEILAEKNQNYDISFYDFWFRINSKGSKVCWSAGN